MGDLNRYTEIADRVIAASQAGQEVAVTTYGRIWIYRGGRLTARNVHATPQGVEIDGTITYPLAAVRIAPRGYKFPRR
jgi:hypothetical protein